MIHSVHYQTFRYIVKNPIGSDYLGLGFIEWPEGNTQTLWTCSDKNGRMETFLDPEEADLALCDVMFRGVEEHFGPDSDEDD